MADPSQGRALKLAELLGASQEARRLGHRVAGTEHVLMATFADPVVRWALSGAGCDMRAVQERVVREGDARREPDEAAAERTSSHVVEVVLTPSAADVISRATADFPDLDPDVRPVPRLLSALLARAMATLLRDEQDSAGVRILDEMDVRRHAASLVAVIERNSGPSVLPRHE